MYKKKCYQLEARLDQQNNTIGNLKNMIKSTIKSEDGFMKTLVKKNVRLISNFYKTHQFLYKF